MAEMTIRLLSDPVTGKKDIIVSLRSDAEALPQEHAQQSGLPSAQSGANTDLARSLGDRESNYAIDANRGEAQRQ